MSDTEGVRRSGAPSGQRFERLAARGDTELAQQALHVRADGVLRDEQALRDLVGAEMLVEQEQDLVLAGRELGGDGVGNPGVLGAALADTVEQAPRDLAGKSGLAVGDAVQ